MVVLEQRTWLIDADTYQKVGEVTDAGPACTAQAGGDHADNTALGGLGVCVAAPELAGESPGLEWAGQPETSVVGAACAVRWRRYPLSLDPTVSISSCNVWFWPNAVSTIVAVSPVSRCAITI